MATADMKFEKVDAKLREELKRRAAPGANEELFEQLMSGETLWTTETDGNKLAGMYQSATRRNYQMHVRKVEREIGGKAVEGHLLWWEPRENEPATA